MKRTSRFQRTVAYLLAVVMAVLMVPTINAAALDANIFPLKYTTKFTIMMLDKDLNGNIHESYVNKNILKVGGKSDPDCVMDILAKKNAAVYAVAPGEITKTGYNSKYGYYVLMRHSDASYSFYAHLKKSIKVRKGQVVKYGTKLGYVGLTGDSDYYHLHFEWSGHDPYCEFLEMGVKMKFGSSSAAKKYQHDHSYDAYVANADSVKVYATASLYSTTLFELTKGTAVKADSFKSSSYWTYITYDNKSGYCKSKYIEKGTPPVAENPAETQDQPSITVPTAAFPLPSNGSYQVSVLDNYSYGTVHASYISQYILGTGASGCRGSVADIAASKGTAVYAVKDGVIYQNNNHSYGGYNVVIKHDDGTYSYYGHLLERSSLSKGTRVTQGQQIGKVGMSGSATGYHLHFEWSGHDPYCEFKSMGINISIMSNSGASVYPHTHSGSIVSDLPTYTAYVTGTDGSLAINSRKSAGYQIGTIPEGAACTVDPNKSSSSWLYVTYNGVSGYSYYKYLSKTAPVTQPEPEPEPEPEPVDNSYRAYVINTDGSLAINSVAKAGNMIGSIPEGASCTVYPDHTNGNWLYVQYNGLYGYSYGSYLTTTAPAVRTGRISGTDGSLAINSIAKAGYMIGSIPEGATCTVFTEKTSGNWVWVMYNGIYGYAYGKYIV